MKYVGIYEAFGKFIDAICASDIFVKMKKDRNFFTEKNILTRDRNCKETRQPIWLPQYIKETNVANLTEIKRENTGFLPNLLLKTEYCYGILLTYKVSRQSLKGGNRL